MPIHNRYILERQGGSSLETTWRPRTHAEESDLEYDGKNSSISGLADSGSRSGEMAPVSLASGLGHSEVIITKKKMPLLCRNCGSHFGTVFDTFLDYSRL